MEQEHENRTGDPHHICPCAVVPPTAEELTGRTQSGLGVRWALVA
eukprot:COSAG02_NODE_16486_length_1079_cov_18.985714_2_plen_44_part_01